LSTVVDKTPPPDLTMGFVPAQIIRAYGFDSLQSAGGKGGGNTIGLVVADDFKIADAQSLWQTFGLTRKDPTVKVIMEAPSTRVVETSLDVEWAGMLAPEADIIVYEAPDIRDTSMLFTWNEAIGLAETSVISDSFGHRETSISFDVAKAYNDGGRMAAAIGMTTLAATGDSGGVDSPSSCPYVTAVGGSNLAVTADGTFESETAWFGAGAGESKYFSKPTFQNNVASGSTHRNVADLALNGQAYYFTKYLGNWEEHGGTSFASPIFAAMVASANSWRANNGKQNLGWLNPALYDPGQSQGIFRDITVGASGALQAAPGWDAATGWGAPDALALAKAIP
jgi:kumamolisin